MKKLIISFVGLYVLAKLLVLTPYFEARSELIYSVSNNLDCLKINERDENYYVMRYLFNPLFKADFFHFKVEPEDFDARFSFWRKLNNDVSLPNNSMSSLYRNSCLLGKSKYQGLVKLSPNQSKKCKANFKIRNSDIFLPEDYSRNFVITCKRAQSWESQEYWGSCVYDGQYNGWVWDIKFPPSKLDYWQSVVRAAEKRFDDSVEVLPFCPIPIFFL